MQETQKMRAKQERFRGGMRQQNDSADQSTDQGYSQQRRADNKNTLGRNQRDRDTMAEHMRNENDTGEEGDVTTGQNARGKNKTTNKSTEERREYQADTDNDDMNNGGNDYEEE